MISKLFILSIAFFLTPLKLSVSFYVAIQIRVQAGDALLILNMSVFMT